MSRHTGGCHCGRVRFEVKAPPAITATQCNCSICSKTGYLHLIVARDDFHLLQGGDALAATLSIPASRSITSVAAAGSSHSMCHGLTRTV